MKLSELKKGQEITIRCKYKDMLVDKKAVVADVRGEVILLNLIRHENQIVDFSSPNVHLIAIYEDGLDMPKAWTNCKIQRKTVDGKEYHALAAPKPSVRVNRRKVPRIVLDMPGILRVTSVPHGIEIVVHDLCVNGIGFQSPVKVEEQEHRHLQIIFTDDTLDEDEETEIKVEARVVWKKELKDGGMYYGCRLTHMEENLGYYVAEKMRQKRE